MFVRTRQVPPFTKAIAHMHTHARPPALAHFYIYRAISINGLIAFSHYKSQEWELKTLVASGSSKLPHLCWRGKQVQIYIDI